MLRSRRYGAAKRDALHTMLNTHRRKALQGAEWLSALVRELACSVCRHTRSREDSNRFKCCQVTSASPAACGLCRPAATPLERPHSLSKATLFSSIAVGNDDSVTARFCLAAGLTGYCMSCPGVPSFVPAKLAVPSSECHRLSRRAILGLQSSDLDARRRMPWRMSMPPA